LNNPTFGDKISKDTRVLNLPRRFLTDPTAATKFHVTSRGRTKHDIKLPYRLRLSVQVELLSFLFGLPAFTGTARDRESQSP